MIVRIVTCVGLIALAYFVGREIGRTESVRDQLRRARDEDDLVPTKPVSGSPVN